MPATTERTRLSLAYFLYFVTLGIFNPYFPAYLRARGLDGVQIGWMLALAPFFKVMVPPLLGFFADRRRGPHFWSVLAAWGTLAGLLLIPLSTNTALLFLCVAIYCAATAPTISLLDSSALHLLQRTQGRYGYIRLWGSIGFIVTSTALGLLFTSLPPHVIIISLIAAQFLFALYIGRLNMAEAPLEESLFKRRGALRALALNPYVWLLLSTIFLNRIAGAPFNAFYTVFVQDIKLGGEVIALTWGLGVTAEVVVLLIVDSLIDRFGSGLVLALGMILEAARWFAYSVFHTKPALLLLAPWHGIAFGALYVASVRAMAEIAPPQLRSLAQGMGTAAAGAGQVFGFIAAGYLLDAAGAANMFMVGGIVGLLAFVNALVFELCKKRPDRAALQS